MTNRNTRTGKLPVLLIAFAVLVGIRLVLFFRLMPRRMLDGLKTLRLATIREWYREQADLARKEALPYEGYLLELINRECETRAHNRIQRLLRESRLPLEKNLDTFDRTRLPTKVDGLVATLLQGDFLDRSENVLAFGNPGSGKTHLLCAIGQHLILEGHRVLFTPCNILVQQLLLAKRDLDLPRLLKRFDRFDGLIGKNG